MSADQQLSSFIRHRSIWRGADDRSLVLIDQRALPQRLALRAAASVADILAAIREGSVQGPARRAVAAAYGLALAARRDPDMAAVMAAFYTLAVLDHRCPLLRGALDRVRDALDISPPSERADNAMAEADAIAQEDQENHLSIGRHALPLLRSADEEGVSTPLMLAAQSGWLSAMGWGAATAALFLAQEQYDLWQISGGRIWQGITPPLPPPLPPPLALTTSPLTAWELAEAGIAHRQLDQATALARLAAGPVSAVWLAVERATPAGDLAVRPDQAALAQAASAAGVPVIACLTAGAIHWRAARPSAIAAPDLALLTADIVSRLVTERGICRPDAAALADLFPEQLSPFDGAANEA
ncbi:hypothetical protein GE253_16995 [Niveispirillum sp. SYP-B3756]|uniref:hypothetical protein n=1 Tax=Niveispirillum sp. SYP-B3756 TaxID=2662178 RepID=UPI00129277D7|nr:hypothetical protein [Niveispirillum sp. SYP-B3756]MQP67027.1 hypothetical protein [Niveispirillum sp. SYP-B3756]